MLYVFAGDRNMALQKGTSFSKALLAKRPDASLVKIEATNVDEGTFEQLLGAQALFVSKIICELRFLSDSKEAKDFFTESLTKLKESPNIFIAIEGDDAAFAKELKKQANEFKYFETKKFFKKEFNNFSLADALGEKDKKKLWVLFEKAMINNVSAEEIHGVLFWQIKAIIQANRSESQKETGLSPFVWSKAKKYSTNYTSDELVQISSALVRLYHESRRGKVMETELEKFILSF